MNVEIGTEAPIFLFWEYLFRNFGILSLQCILYIHDNMHLNYSYEQNYGCFFGSFYFYYVSIQCEAMTTVCVPDRCFLERKFLDDATLTVPKIPISVCNPRNETAPPRSKFLHSCIRERFIYFRDRSDYLAAAKISTEKLGNRLVVRGEGITPTAPTPFSSLLDK
jgi:hypothetical protein